jgi:hypothetical protein
MSTSRRSYQHHHVRYRSRGGDNARSNRITICEAHHLHGIHRGTVRACGSAPHGIRWELGVRVGAASLLSFVGDRIPEVDRTQGLTG